MEFVLCEVGGTLNPGEERLLVLSKKDLDPRNQNSKSPKSKMLAELHRKKSYAGESPVFSSNLSQIYNNSEGDESIRIDTQYSDIMSQSFDFVTRTSTPASSQEDTYESQNNSVNNVDRSRRSEGMYNSNFNDVAPHSAHNTPTHRNSSSVLSRNSSNNVPIDSSSRLSGMSVYNMKNTDVVNELNLEKQRLKSELEACREEITQLEQRLSSSKRGDAEREKKIDTMFSILTTKFPLISRDSSGDPEGEIFIGPNTFVKEMDYIFVNFRDPIKAARDLAVIVFGKTTLASSTISGKASNAHRNKEPKHQLDQEKLTAIIKHVMLKFEEVKPDKVFLSGTGAKKVERPLLEADLISAIATKCTTSARALKQ